MTFEIYEVGGCVRDELLGLPVKDIDHTVVGPASFEEMCEELKARGFHIYATTPDTFNARCRFPADWEFAGRKAGRLDADVVLARSESGYADGRHPDNVQVGTLADDLNRRDFTVNALAKDKDGNIIDLHNGLRDLEIRDLSAIGGAQRSFTDDALRAMRALRFHVTKKFSLDMDIIKALKSTWLPPLLAKISHERRQEELDRMFKYNNLVTLNLLAELTPALQGAIFNGYRLTTTAKRK